jgi:arylformamidase
MNPDVKAPASSRFIDITPSVSEKIGVFPGDVPFNREVSYDFKKGDHLLLSSIRSTLHLGAHADGPNHYSATGEGIGERDISIYAGKCLVLRATAARGERVGLHHLAEKWRALSVWPAPRVLVHTGSFPDPNAWNSDFCSFDPALIEIWAKAGVKLVGIDTPSIDPEDSKTLDSHHMVERYDLAILEGLVLEAVPEGLYTLMAFPLKIAGADASPVRAVLFRDASVFGG